MVPTFPPRLKVISGSFSPPPSSLACLLSLFRIPPLSLPQGQPNSTLSSEKSPVAASLKSPDRSGRVEELGSMAHDTFPAFIPVLPVTHCSIAFSTACPWATIHDIISSRTSSVCQGGALRVSLARVWAPEFRSVRGGRAQCLGNCLSLFRWPWSSLLPSLWVPKGQEFLTSRSSAPPNQESREAKL